MWWVYQVILSSNYFAADRKQKLIVGIVDIIFNKIYAFVNRSPRLNPSF